MILPPSLARLIMSYETLLRLSLSCGAKIQMHSSFTLSLRLCWSMSARNDNVSERVSTAIQGLQSATDRVIQRYERQRKQRPSLPTVTSSDLVALKQIIRQIKYCSVNLLRQLTSLDYAVKAWNEVWRINLHRLSTKSAETWFAHIFTQIVRLHDALILCVSGECRHDADKKRKRKFTSYLNDSSERADGYTQLYSSDKVYSGTSWDEIMDENNGLQRRLLKVLGKYVPPKRRESLWDSDILEHGGQAIEQIFTEAETKLQSLQLELSKVGKQVRNDIPKSFLECSSITLHLSDRNESLICKVGHKVFKLERLAGDFQLNDQRGVLPFLDTIEWKQIFSSKPNNRADKEKCAKPAKKRKVLEDSDDDTGSANPEAPKGLSVKVKENSKSSHNVDSVKDIKETMGVNADQLEASRETIEKEQTLSTEAAAQIDLIPTTEVDDAELKQDIIHATNKVKRLKRGLRKATRLNDDDQVWDARASLRQALMEAGNLMLWNNSNADQGDREQELESVVEYFYDARYCVEAQEILWKHFRATKRVDNDDPETIAQQYELELQRGQANANTGIALVEQSRLKTLSPSKRRSCLKQATPELESAITVAENLLSVPTKSPNSLDNETIIASQHLQCLGSRWLASSLWRQNRTRESVRVFTNTWSMAENDSNDLLPVTTEAYYASASLIDLISTSLSRGKAFRPDDEEFYLDTLSCATEAACDLSGRISQIGTPSYLKSNDIRTKDELQCSKRELVAWWNSSSEKLPLLQSEKLTAGDLPRSDVLRFGCPTSSEPTGFYVFNEQRRRSRNRCFLGGSAHPHSGSVLDEHGTMDILSEQPATINCQPWGDELLPQLVNEKSGLSEPDIKYPAIAPLMPPEIRAIVERFRRDD